MTIKKTVAKKTAKISTVGNAKKKAERLEKDLKEAGKKTTNKKCALHKKPIPLHIEQEIAQCVDTNLAKSEATKQSIESKALPMLIYVGIYSENAFLRNFEEHAVAEDYSYHIIETAIQPTKNEYPSCEAVIGPFRSMSGALVFRDREGVNSVEEAERLAR